MLAKCRRAKSYIGRDTSGTTIDRVSTECRPTIDRLLTAISTEYRPSIDRVSTEYRPSVDRVSTECRPTIDRLSTDCRPLYRPITRSTLPIVNKIQVFYLKHTAKKKNKKNKVIPKNMPTINYNVVIEYSNLERNYYRSIMLSTLTLPGSERLTIIM